MLSTKPLPALGDIKGSIYDFEYAGDVLPEHIHDEASAHITIVCRGRIKAYAAGWEREAGPGQIVNFLANQPHAVVSLEDNTRIINIVKEFATQ